MKIKKKKIFKFTIRKKKRGRPKKKKNRFFLKVFAILLVLFIVAPSIIFYMWFKENILEKLPSVSKIEDIAFSQTTVITDRNGIILYKVYDENRKYVPLEKISKNMQNALIAIEDKNFWTNPGIDLQGIIRAGFHDLFFGKKQGASTLTQQLIKNLILTREKTIIRKLKELVLAVKLNDYLSKKIKQQYPNLNNQQIKQKVKEKILEMYLNYVFFGNNSYGVEAASETYFHKSAYNLSILESAILAALPKSPVNYDPIKHRKNNLGELQILSSTGLVINLSNDDKEKIEQIYIDYLKGLSFSIVNSEQEILKLLSPNNLYYKNYKIKYYPGRAIFVLARMYIDGYINKVELIQAIKESFSEKIYSPKINIKAPWFVFYVLNNLYKKYGEDVVSKAGWTIKTSLDWNIQQLANQSINEWADYLQKKGANNSALLYVDTKNGDILAYVGSKDYYNEDIDGKVDMITAERQCGSVIKPLIYANAFIKNSWFTPETPIYDVKFDIAGKGNTFNNFDGKFLGLLPIRKALSYSRNIPAAKMYFLGGGEYPVKEFLRKIGLTTISNKIYYGYPLAIGAANVTMMSMAQAYSYLSNIEGAVKIDPILEIKGPDGSLIYRKKTIKLPNIIPTGIVSMLWYILSNPANRPYTWNNIMQIKGLTLATKSGTTNMVDPKTGKKYPRDGWFISYSPSKVFVVWAGNTDGKHMGVDAYGGWTAGKIWRTFVQKLKDNGYIKDEKMLLKDTKTVSINSLNGKLANENTPYQISHKTIARIDGILPQDDGLTVKLIKLDKLCNGLPSKYTPENQIVTAYLIRPTSLNPNNIIWEQPVKNWWKNFGVKIYEKIFNSLVLLQEPTNICEDRKIIAQKGPLKFNISWPKNGFKVAYVFDLWLSDLNTPFPLKTIDIYIDNNKVITYNYSSPLFTVILPNTLEPGYHKLTLTLNDSKGYSASRTIDIKLVKTDKDAPFLEKVILQNGKYVYVFKDNTSKVVGGYLDCNGKKQKFSGPIVVSNYKDCKYSILDYYGNSYSTIDK